MQSITSVKNNSNITNKKHFPNMPILKMVKAYLFMVLNRYFFIGNGIYCSESDDDDSFSEKSMKCSKFKEEIQEKLNNECQAQASSKEQPEKSEQSSGTDSLSVTSETERFDKNYNVHCSTIRAFLMNLEKFSETTATNLTTNFIEMINLVNQIEENIEVTKKQPKAKQYSYCQTVENCPTKAPATQEQQFLKYAKQFCFEGNNFCKNFNLKITLMLADAYDYEKKLVSFRSELEKIKLNSYFGLDDFNKRIDKSNIYKAVNTSLEEIKSIVDHLKEGIKQANSVLSIIIKYNTLTLEEFEADEEFEKMKLALNNFY